MSVRFCILSNRICQKIGTQGVPGTCSMFVGLQQDRSRFLSRILQQFYSQEWRGGTNNFLRLFFNYLTTESKKQRERTIETYLVCLPKRSKSKKGGASCTFKCWLADYFTCVFYSFGSYFSTVAGKPAVEGKFIPSQTGHNLMLIFCT